MTVALVFSSISSFLLGWLIQRQRMQHRISDITKEKNAFRLSWEELRTRYITDIERAQAERDTYKAEWTRLAKKLGDGR